MPPVPNAPWSGGSAPGAVRHTVDGDHTVASPADGQVPRIYAPFGSDSPKSTALMFSFSPQGRDGNGNLIGFYDLFPAAGGGWAAHKDFIIEQEFEIAADHYARLPNNTPYVKEDFFPTYEGELELNEAILVDESIPQPIGLGLVRFTRTYAKVPGQPVSNDGVIDSQRTRLNTFESCQYTFPGIESDFIFVPTFNYSSFLPNVPNGFNVVSLNDGRPPYTTDVTMRVQHDFFIMEDGEEFEQLSEDPDSKFYVIPEFRVYFGTYWATRDYVSNLNASDSANGSYENPTGLGNEPTAVQTTPPKYFDDLYLIFGYTHDLVFLSAEICVKGSIFRQWRGNIWERVTCFAIAQ